MIEILILIFIADMKSCEEKAVKWCKWREKRMKFKIKSWIWKLKWISFLCIKLYGYVKFRYHVEINVFRSSKSKSDLDLSKGEDTSVKKLNENRNTVYLYINCRISKLWFADFQCNTISNYLISLLLGVS